MSNNNQKPVAWADYDYGAAFCENEVRRLYAELAYERQAFAVLQDEWEKLKKRHSDAEAKLEKADRTLDAIGMTLGDIRLTLLDRKVKIFEILDGYWFTKGAATQPPLDTSEAMEND